MALTMNPGGIGTAAVEEICALPDPVYRNCWITYGYYDISRRLHRLIGDNASWCTFARWSSATVGESLRLDQDSRRLDSVFSRWYLNPFRSIAQEMYRDARTISDGAMPRILAQGNHYVFHEIGHAVAGFLEWFEACERDLARDDDEAWMSAWREYRETIEPFREADELFRPGDVAWLRDGIECYFMAARPGIDADERARHVLKANILLASYEQWRLDPVLRIALDPFAKHLVEFRAAEPHATPAPGEYPRAVLRHRGTRWALKHQSALRRWAVEKYAGMLTRHWMTLNVPIDDCDNLEAIVLGEGVPDSAANAAFLRQRRLEDRDITKLVAIYDHNPDRHTRGARNWSDFAERMQFIVELFLALQKNENLYTEICEDELALLRLDLQEENLDRARTICDEAMDDYVRAHCELEAEDPRALVHDLIRSGLRSSLPTAVPEPLRGDPPPWADTDKLERGQEFFRDNGLAIATALFTASLPLSYTATRGARVLTSTAELASGNVNRRVAETGRMLLDMMTLDGANPPLHPETPGWHAARGVRLFHAAVRHMLWARAPENERESLRPINQEDLLGALVAFTVVVLDSLDKMGVRVCREDEEAYVHLWMVTAHLLGIDFTLVHRDEGEGRSADPLTMAELRILGNALWRRNARASADGQTLTAALMHMFRDTMPGPLRDLPPAATRLLIGDEAGDILEVPRAGAPARLVLRVGRPVTRLVTRGRRVGFFPGRLQRRTVRLYEHWISTHHGDRPPWHVDDDHLKKKLRLRYTESPQQGRRAEDRAREARETPTSGVTAGS